MSAQRRQTLPALVLGSIAVAVLRLLGFLRALPRKLSGSRKAFALVSRTRTDAPKRRPRAPRGHRKEQVAKKASRPNRPKSRRGPQKRKGDASARRAPRTGARKSRTNKARAPRQRSRTWRELAFLHPKIGRILIVTITLFNLLPLLAMRGTPALAGVITYGGNVGTGLGEACSASGTQDVITPEADTWADETLPNTNHGSNSLLKSGAPSLGNLAITYMRFALPTPPPNCDITSASLRMNKYRGGLHQARLARAAAPWNENTMTWNNHPGTTGPSTAVTTVDGLNQWDVTSLTRTLYSGNVANDGIVLTDNNATMSEYDSREGFTPPQLVITWGGSAGTSLSLDVTSNVPRGNSVVVSYSSTNSTSGPVTASDSQGNVYSVDADRTTSDGSRVVLLSAHSVKALSAGDTITVSHPLASGRAVSANHFSGLAPTNALDKTSTGEGSGTSLSAGTVSTSQANELVVGAFEIDGTTAQFTRGAGFSATPSVVAPGDGQLHTEYRIVSTTGSYTANGSTNISAGWAGAMATYKMDMDNPVVTITSPAANSYTSDSTPTLSGTASAERSDSDTITVKLHSGPNTSGPVVQNLSATRNGAGNWSVDASLLADGQYTVVAEQTDNATNKGTSAPVTFRVDASSPASPTLSGPDTPGNSTTVQWTFTGESGATFECRLEKDGSVVEPLASCTSPAQYSLTDGDGNYTFFVRQLDQAGNQSSFASADYTLDTDQPAAPTLGGTSGRGNDTTAQWTFSGETNATFECRLEREGVVVDPMGPCTSPVTHTLAGGDGNYTFFVRQVDEAGNPSTESSRSYDLDTAEPETQIDSGPDGPTQNNDPSFSFSSDESGVTYECRLNGADFAPCTSPQSYTDLSDGIHTFRVRALDGAENVDSTPAERIFTVDTTDPSAPTVVGPASPGNDETPQWSITGEPNATFECRLEKNGSVIEPTGSCTSVVEHTLTDGDGVYSFFVRQIDEAGNVSPFEQQDYELDTNDPAAPEITRPGEAGNNLFVTLEFDTEAGATAECRLAKGSQIIEDFRACTSPDIYNLVDGDGVYTFTVRQKDEAGNVSPDASHDYELDTDPPETSIDSGPSGPVPDSDASFSFSSDEPAATFECNFDGSGYVPCSSPQDYTSLGDGEHTFRVRATDVAENVDATPAERTFTVDTGAPVVTIDSSPEDPGNDQTPTWTFSTESGAALDCRLTAGPRTLDDWADCDPGSAEYDLSGENDDTYTFEVRTTDAAGNNSVAFDTYVLDRGEPNSEASSPALVADPDFTVMYTYADGSSGVQDVELWVRGPNDSDYELAATDSTLSSSFDFSAVDGDGAYRFYTRAIDRAGNRQPAPEGPHSVTTVDTEAPEVSIDGAPADPTNTSPFVFSFSSADGSATFDCSFTDDGTTSYEPCTSSAVFPDNGDGMYTFRVRATDPAGNVGSTQTATFEFDATTPEQPELTGPATPGNDTAPEWSFTGEPDAVFECRLEKGGLVLTHTIGCVSPFGATLSAGDGTYTFFVRQIDEAGNASAFEQIDYVLDTDAPAAPEITGPAEAGNEESITLEFTTDSGTTAQCKILKGSEVIQDFTSCSSPQPFTLADGDGTYTFVVRQVDEAGNISAEDTTTYVLDTAVPDTQIDSGPAGPVSYDNPSFSFSSDESGVTFECRMDDGPFVSCTSPKEYTSLSDGSHSFAVRALDAGGNVDASPATRDFAVDTSVPAPPDITGPASPGNDTSPDWEFAGEPAAAFECRVEKGGVVVSPTAPCSSPRQYALSEGDGVYTFLVRQIDEAGNVSPFAEEQYDLDTNVPGTTIDSGPQGLTTDPSPAFEFTSDENGAGFECDLDGSGWTPCTSPASYTSLSDGPHAFRVRAFDAAGNVDATPGERLFTIDTNAPATPALSGPGSPTNNTSPQWTFTGEPGGTFECRLEKEGQVVDTPASCTSPKDHTLRDGDGTYTFSVRQVDDAGNSSPWASDNVRLDTDVPAAPNVTSPSGHGSSTSVSLAFTKDDDTVAECSLVKGEQVIDNWRTCSSPEGYSLSDGDGTYTFFVRQMDEAGNVSPNGSQSYDLDTQNPETTIDSGPSGLTNNASPSWAFSSNESNVRYECEVDGEGFTSCDSPKTLSSLSDGDHTFRVRARDLADNVDPSPAERTITLDTGAPPVSIDSSPVNPGNDARPRWDFSTEPGASLHCELSFGGEVLLPFEPCDSGTAAYDLQGDGTYTFTVRATDAAGNSATAADAYTFDTGLPDSVAWSPALTADPNIELTYTHADGLSQVIEVELWVRGPNNSSFQRVSSDTSPESPSFSYSASQGDGTYYFFTRSIDQAGNREDVPADADSTTILDTQAPDVIIESGPDSPTTTTPFTFTFSSSDPEAAYECSLTNDGSEDYIPCGSPVTYPDAGVGSYTFLVRAIDATGNVGEPSAYEFAFTEPEPSITPSITPSVSPSPSNTIDPTPTITVDPTEPPTQPPTEQPTVAPTDPVVPPPPEDVSPPVETAEAPPAPKPPRKDEPEPKEEKKDEPRPQKPEPTPPPPEEPTDERDLADLAATTVEAFGFPLVLALLVAVYLALQYWIDRKDPKLAMAPVHSKHDLARFA